MLNLHHWWFNASLTFVSKRYTLPPSYLLHPLKFENGRNYRYFYFSEFNEEELEIESYVRLENITRELIILKSGMTVGLMNVWNIMCE